MKKNKRNYWNYRVIVSNDATGKFHRVCEVHYKDGKPYAYNEAKLCGGNKKEMKWVLRQFKKAVTRKPIDESIFQVEDVPEEI